MTEIGYKDIKLPSRSLVTNKGDAGRVLIIGGDVGMAGAVAFSAEASYRSGAGLVEVSSHIDNRIVLQTLIPEAIFSSWENASLSQAKAVVIGVGMGRSTFALRTLERVLTRCSLPLVVDADAINLIAENDDFFALLNDRMVLTPHIAEFSRLTGLSFDEIKKNPEKCATDFVKKYNVNLVLKDKETVIALSDGSVYMNKSGSSALSKGGTGDVLTGIIASFIAQGVSLENATVWATFIHGKAGELAGERLGERGTMARDIIMEIPNALKII